MFLNVTGVQTCVLPTYAMLSCQTRGGQYAYTREGQCYWGKLAYRKLDRDATSDMTGVDEISVELMGGVQVALWDDVRLGFALGYEKSESTSKSTTQTLGETDGQRIQGGFVLKNQWGPVNAYLNLAGSFGRYDSERSVLLTGPTDIAKGEQDIASAMSRLRLSYLVDMGSVYLRPMVDLSATYINLGGYTETGSSANMAISETDTWMLSVAPSIELGGEFRTAGNTVVRPYVRAGATFLNTDELSVSANFANAPVGVTPFLITGKIEDVYADVEAGMHFLTDNGLNLRFTYDGRFAEHSQQHAGSVKVGVKY